MNKTIETEVVRATRPLMTESNPVTIGGRDVRTTLFYDPGVGVERL